MRRFLLGFLQWLLRFAVILALFWSAGVLFLDGPGDDPLNLALAVVWLVGGGVCWLFGRRVSRMLAAGCFLIILVYWLGLQPKQNRDWSPEVARTAWAKRDGDEITVHNIRDFIYDTGTNYTVNYGIRTYSLSRLKGIDLFINFWGSDLLSHPIVSFDFGPGSHLAFSVEIRPERDEPYFLLGGVYRRYEIIYIAAEERDVVKLRTNFRPGETVYLYRLDLPPDVARTRFLEYINRLNQLHDRPEWYNAITDNCTTSVRAQVPRAERTAWDWRMLFNGRLDELLYERGRLDRSMPFPELKKVSLINQKARAADGDPNFSTLIRRGLPGMTE
jgi:hypothetical protein